MTRTTLFLFVAALGLICSGCLSSNPERAERTVSKWVPAGISVDEATKIMKQHGFAYNATSTASCGPLGDVVFDKTGPIHYWAILVHVENGNTTTNISVKVWLTAFLNMKT